MALIIMEIKIPISDIQLTFTYSKPTKETLEKGVEYVKSQQ